MKIIKETMQLAEYTTKDAKDDVIQKEEYGTYVEKDKKKKKKKKKQRVEIGKRY